ncbi:hypothetical protein M758_3G153600 [Ceratodon purpureus]|nr:hypothetical protein M758_3G153600 [Ceratodon purpureus]
MAMSASVQLDMSHSTTRSSQLQRNRTIQPRRAAGDGTGVHRNKFTLTLLTRPDSLSTGQDVFLGKYMRSLSGDILYTEFSCNIGNI